MKQIHPTSRDVEANFTIRQVANSLKLSLRTIRFYEVKGLISPKRVGRRRIFSHSDVVQLNKIVEAKSMGYTLSEIRVITQATVCKGSKSVRISRRKVEDQLKYLTKQREVIDVAIGKLYSSLAQSGDGRQSRWVTVTSRYLDPMQPSAVSITSGILQQSLQSDVSNRAERRS